MPRSSAWATKNRDKLRAYSRAYRKSHPEYFAQYEAKNHFKLKIIRKLWNDKNRKYQDYYTKEQRREYLRIWRQNREQNKVWGKEYLETLIK